LSKNNPFFIFFIFLKPINSLKGNHAYTFLQIHNKGSLGKIVEKKNEKTIQLNKLLYANHLNLAISIC